MAEINVVTGVSGYSGKYIARRLLSQGMTVVNLTGHPDRPTEFGDQITSVPFNFDNPSELTESLRGVTTLYNTYWIRFPQGDLTYKKAVENSKILIKAAEDAGVKRIVHVSIANPSEDSPFPYYSGKAQVEKAITCSQLTYAILRPTVLFGPEGILINNIAWFLRHLPVFAVPGSGEYKLQPIFVEDLADLAVQYGASSENIIMDAIGPEIYTFNDLIQLLKETIRSKAFIMHLNPRLAVLATGMLGKIVNDVVLTNDEVKGLEANLLVSDKPPTGHTRLSEWLTENADWIGTIYFSEVKKHYK